MHYYIQLHNGNLVQEIAVDRYTCSKNLRQKAAHSNENIAAFQASISENRNDFKTLSRIGPF